MIKKASALNSRKDFSGKLKTNFLSVTDSLRMRFRTFSFSSAYPKNALNWVYFSFKINLVTPVINVQF